jgi:exonuclease SbcC
MEKEINQYQVKQNFIEQMNTKLNDKINERSRLTKIYDINKHYIIIDNLISNNELVVRNEFLERELVILNDKINKLTNISNDIKNKKERFEELCQEIHEYENDKLIFGYIKKILDKNGLVDKILSNNIIPILKSSINNILSRVCHYKIDIYYKNESVNIFKDDGLNINMSSGYESYILDLVFRLSLTKINNYIKTNFIMIDEGFNACDSEHKNNVKDLLELMKEHYDWLLIISHDEFIKSFYDMDIRINKIKDEFDINGSNLILK